MHIYLRSFIKVLICVDALSVVNRAFFKKKKLLDGAGQKRTGLFVVPTI